MIIDFHTHLGNILYANGGSLIPMKGIEKRRLFDPVALAESGLYRSNALVEWLISKPLADTVTKACRARNDAGTSENSLRSMDENGVESSVCLPIAPYVTFEDLEKANHADPRFLPFTSVDFGAGGDVSPILARDVAAGALGLKLHPIIQREPLTSGRTKEAVEAFAPHGLPVLFHTGVQSYYLGKEKTENQRPEYGDPRGAVELVSDFPGVAFVAGHAGIMMYREVMECFAGRKNVYIDISFQSPENIRELIAAFGAERILYGSDWPWGDRGASIASVRKACRGDAALERQIFRENAARLLKLG